MSSPSARSTSPTSSGRGRPACPRSARNSAASAASRACPTAEYADGSPRSSRASTRLPGSAVRSVTACSITSGSITPGGVWPGPPGRSAARASATAPRCSPRRPVRSAARASQRERRPSATRSRGPIRHRGEVSSRASASAAVGSCITRSVATTSWTSGTVSRPPRPTTSTGMPRASSAARSAGNWARLRQSTAMSAGWTRSGRPSGQPEPSGPTPGGSLSIWAIRSAIHSASLAAVSSSAQTTWPRAALGGGATRRGTSGAEARRPSWMAAAASRTRPVLRKLVDSSAVRAGVPDRTGKSVANRRRLPAVAPRQP